MVFGLRPLIEAIEAGKPIDKLFFQKGLKGDLAKELSNLCRHHRIPVQFVPVEKLNRITRKNHQGVIGFIAPVHFHALEDLLPNLFERPKAPLLIVLDGVTDVRNFGSIARSAECAGADAIVIPQKGSAQVNADAVKTSAGALFNIPICKEADLRQSVRFLQHSGVQVVACTEKAEKHYFEVDFTLPTALILGAEDMGISTAHLKVADHLARIPMQGNTGSLNVAVAGGVILFEALRQRLN